jgi:hypothetical protein
MSLLHYDDRASASPRLRFSSPLESKTGEWYVLGEKPVISYARGKEIRRGCGVVVTHNFN